MRHCHIVSAVPALLSCENCDLTLLGFESRGPIPINHDECPRCGSEEFSFDGQDSPAG